MNSWLLITFDDAQRQHAGNSGYDDQVESIYRWDESVPNAARIAVGDLAVIRSDVLLGIARIKDLVVAEGTKLFLRCPSCRRTSIKRRKYKQPEYRCSKCGTDFDEPYRENAEVRLYEARFGNTFARTPEAVTLADLRAACPRYNGQHSMQTIDLGRILPALLAANEAVAELLDTRALQSGLEHEADQWASKGGFDPRSISEAVRRQLRAIAIRQGQPEFRNLLMSAYSGQCAVTGTAVPQALEAAHIVPYQGQTTNHVQNGLLLRADIHTLFDRKLLSVDPESWEIVVHPDIRQTLYGDLHGVRLRPTDVEENRPSRIALARHRASCNF